MGLAPAEGSQFLIGSEWKSIIKLSRSSLVQSLYCAVNTAVPVLRDHCYIDVVLYPGSGRKVAVF